jgi:hypothetical protein
MKKILIPMMALAILTTSCIKDEFGSDRPTDNLSAKLTGDTDGEILGGSLLVRMDVPEGTDVASLLEGTGVKEVVPALKVMPKNIKVAQKYGLLQWYELKFDESVRPQEIAGKVAAEPAVRAVQYNSVLERVGSDMNIEADMTAMTKAGGDLLFNDPMLSDQWNLINTGDKAIAATAVAGADVGVKDAWSLCAGDPRIVVAVFDEGVRVSHDDLKDAMWVNPGETSNGKDDDNNGYADDINGYNFAEGKSRPSASYGHDHGTHVAGTVAAVNNNGKGVSSIAGGTGNKDGVRIMSCQIFKEGSKTADQTVAEAFIYAADNGACIAQCSYGSVGGSILSDSDYINGIEGKTQPASFEHAALQYFMDPENSNCDALETNIAVFAAGNDSGPASSYPGALPFCISVTAFGPDFLPGGYSNRGPGCDIAAPGGDPWLAPVLSNEAPCMVLSTGITSGGGAGYVYKYGTSMACPHVSGVVALGMSYALQLGRKFTREEFTSMLLTSVNDIDGRLGSGSKKYGDGTFDLSSYKGRMGTGAVDAYRFLTAIEGIPSIQVKTGEKVTIDLSAYLGGTAGNFEFAVSVDTKARESLGLASDPVIKNGKLELTCSKVGGGRIRLSSSVGKDSSREDGISGLDFSREVSIISRPFVSDNGGWL